MIVVAGEALVDVIADASGTLLAMPGGAPFNVAANVARLGVPCTFLGRISEDPFGVRLRAELESAGVTLAAAEPVSVPTTLALAQLDEAGVADYRFYIVGTSAAALQPSDLPASLLAGARALALGGLGLVYEPIRSTLLGLVAQLPADVAVVLDPNCRPRATPDLASYRETIATLLARVDVLKISAEDVAVLAPGTDPVQYGVDALAVGPQAVLITHGPDSVSVITPAGVRSVPVPPVQVVDTIGAGDAFVAGVLAWLHAQPDFDPRAIALDALCRGVEAAIGVAAAVCRVRGAALPDDFVWDAGLALS
jgi:fructokinase